MLPASNTGPGMSIGFPDVCLTPMAPAPVPIPYPNLAMNATSVGFSPTVLICMLPALNMMCQVPMTCGDEPGAAHPLFKMPGGYTMGQPVILVNGAPAISLCMPTYGNMFNNPIGAKLVPDVVMVLMNSAGDTVNGAGPSGAGGARVDAASALATLEGRNDGAPGWSLQVDVDEHGRIARAVIVQVRRRTPAFAAGLQAGDEVLALNGTPIGEYGVSELPDVIVGEVGLWVSLRRCDVMLQPVPDDAPAGVCHIIGLDDHGVGRIELDAMPADAAQQIDRAITELRARGPLTALEIDLCHNPGGDIHAAAELAARFLPAGLELCTLIDAEGDRRVRRSMHPAAYDLPLTLRVNGETASAAELFAGILQAHSRARVVGKRTFGKGVVRVIAPAADHVDTATPTTAGVARDVCAVELPGGRMIDGVGIIPD